jgi:hypothetical protein
MEERDIYIYRLEANINIAKKKKKKPYDIIFLAYEIDVLQ